MKRSKPKPPASLVPHECVVLALDPGASSGWAIFSCGRLVASGPAASQADRVAACDRARTEAEVTNLPLVVVAERWTASRFAKDDRRMNPATLAGLGAAWGMWKAAIEAALPKHPERRILRVAQSTWKAKILGRTNLKHAIAVSTMRAIASKAGANEHGPEDEHAAVCIGLWAVRAGEVAAVLPKPKAPRATKGARAA